MDKCREEFEIAYEPNPHKSPFTEVRFNQDKRIYEPLNPPHDYIARSLNAAWYGWRIRQKRVDFVEVQLSLLRDKNKTIEIELANSRDHADELQSRVDAALQEIKGAARWIDEDAIDDPEFIKGGALRALKRLEQALKGGEV